MTELQWGLVIWGGLFFGVFLGLELPAHFGLVPWPTLSRTVWDGIKDWYPIAYIVALALVVLLGHFEWQWPVGWLIGVSALGAALISLHLILR